MNLGEWKRWAGRLKSETYALYLAYRDPRMPWYAKLFAALVVGYAFSPIDLIPDAIPTWTTSSWSPWAWPSRCG